MKKNEYKCAMCGEIFVKGWGDEEANKEAEELWGVKSASERMDFSVICDDCFQKIHPSKYPEVVEGTRKELKEQK